MIAQILLFKSRTGIPYNFHYYDDDNNGMDIDKYGLESSYGEEIRYWCKFPENYAYNDNYMRGMLRNIYYRGIL